MNLFQMESGKFYRLLKSLLLVNFSSTPFSDVHLLKWLTYIFLTIINIIWYFYWHYLICHAFHMLSAEAIFTDLNVDLGNQLIYENKENPLTVSLTGVTHADATNVRGNNLWQVAVYGSRRPDGSGVKTGYDEQILDPQEASTTLNDGENLPLTDVSFGFDLSGARCEDSQYVCFDLNKNARASVDFHFEARPDESVLTQCVDMRDRCKGRF